VFKNSNLAKHAERDHVIVGLKSTIAKEPDAELVSRQFPFRVAKSSKYGAGIEKLYR
jgi:hypothetical protein